MRGAALFLALFLAQAALAEPTRILSGEHAAYTRIVVPLGNATDWRIGRDGRRVTVKFGAGADRFDASAVFERIPRQRVSDVSAQGDLIELELNCDCAVGSFVDRGAYLVIDIAQSDSELIPAASPVSDDRANKSPRIAVEAPVLQAFRFPTLGTHLVQPLSQAERTVLENVGGELSVALEMSRRRNLLTPAKAAPHPPPLSEASAPDERNVPRTTDPGTSATAPLTETPNLRITTSRDLPEGLPPRLRASVSAKAGCPSKEVLDLASWADGRSFSVQLGEMRGALYDARDRLAPGAALDLARLYLHFGFGAEARNALAMYPDEDATSVLLQNFADIFDGRPLEPAGVAEQLGDCTGDAALLHLLSLPLPPVGGLARTDPVLQALNALPAHLRRIFAPKVSERLLAYGAPGPAAMALRSLERMPDPMPSAGQLMQARVALKTGDRERADSKLEEVIVAGKAEAPDALIALVDAHLAADQPIAPDIADLVEAYAQELRNGPLGPELRRAHVLALTNSGQFDRAFATARETAKQTGKQAARKLRRQMLRALTASASDVVFLEHAFDAVQDQPDDLAGADRRDFAARLLELGFPAQAEKAMTAHSTVQEDRILAARIALAMDKPLKANAEVAALTGPEADLLRAESRRLAGAHDDAHRLYAAAAREEDAVESAWLAEEWRNLLQSDSADFGPMRDLSDSRLAVVDGGDGMLARSAALLQEAAQARETVAALLASERLRIAPAE